MRIQIDQAESRVEQIVNGQISYFAGNGWFLNPYSDFSFEAFRAAYDALVDSGHSETAIDLANRYQDSWDPPLTVSFHKSQRESFTDLPSNSLVRDLTVYGDLDDPDNPNHLALFFQSNDLGQLEVLHINDADVTSGVMQSLVSNSTLVNLRELYFGGDTSVSDDASHLLAQSSLLDSLTHLGRVGWAFEEQLSSRHLPKLTYLAESSAPELIELLDDSEKFPNVTSIGICAPRFDPLPLEWPELDDEDEGTDEEEEAFTNSVASLIQDDRWVPALLNSRHLANRLEELWIFWAIGTDGFRRLIAGEFPNLHSLNACNVSITEEFQNVELTDASLPKLQRLSLAYNAIQDLGWRALARWPGFQSLTTLDLSNTGATDLAIDAVLEIGDEFGWQNVDIGQNDFSALSISKLLSNPSLQKSLVELRLSDIDLSNWAAISKTSWNFESLKNLDLRATNINHESLGKLITEFGCDRLSTLSLSTNFDLDRTGIQAVCDAAWIKQLNTLDLSFCNLTDEDLVPLMELGSSSSLRHLHLGGNKITGRGLVDLIESGALHKVWHLDLMNNDVDDSAASQFERAEHLPELVSLNLFYNRLSQEKTESIKTWLSDQHVRRIAISRQKAI